MGKLLQRLTIGFKVSLLAGLPLAIALAVGFVAVIMNNKIGNEIEEIAEGHLPLIGIIAEVETQQLEQAILFERAFRLAVQAATDTGITSRGSADIVAEFEDAVEEFVKLGHKINQEYEDAEAVIDTAIVHASGAEAIENFEYLRAEFLAYEELHNSYEEHAEAVLHLLEQGQFDAALSGLAQVEEEEIAANKKIEKIFFFVADRTEESALQAEAHEKSTLTIVIIMLASAFVIGLLLAWLIGTGIANPLKAMTGAMLQLADGDMSVDIPGTDRSDEIGEMAGAVQVFKKNAIESERLEEQLRQSQKLEALGRLAGGIAHDFNNLLLPIITIAEVTRDDFPPDGRQWANLDKVVKAGQRGRALVDQILKFSRRQPMHRQPIGLADVVEEALELARALIPSMIQIREHIDDDVGTVLADPNQIHEVIMNLVSNAGQAIGLDKGVINVGLRKASIDDAGDGPMSLPAGTYARLTVSDSGAGMDDETLANIFDPFFTTKPAGEGTGMGLAAVHGIVAQHDGAIRVSSEPGKQTTFEIYLPILD